MSHSAIQPFSPPSFPPVIKLEQKEIYDLVIKARAELAELKGYASAMPNPLLLLSPAIIKESLASSEIENINTTVEQVLKNQLFAESEQRPADKEVLRYRNAIMYGFEQMPKFPISTRLIIGINKQLLPHNSYADYRTTQNKIVNSLNNEVIYIPPLASEVHSLMGNWENYIHTQDDKTDPLIKAAISHYQFEAIHPFGDGNGRTGRILIVLYLIQEDILTLPILYISGYINRNRADYYRLLNEVTTKQAWKPFVIFMLTAFYVQAKETKEILLNIMGLFRELKTQIKNEHANIYTSDLVECLFSYPITTPMNMAAALGIHRTTATRYLNQLKSKNILTETVMGTYHFYINHRLLDVMNKR